MLSIYFLTSVRKYLDSLILLTISTPDASYPNLNLVHVDYRREARQGATLLLVQLWFQEIRIAQKSTAPNTAEPSGSVTVDIGQVSPVPPSAAQNNNILGQKDAINFGVKNPSSWD